MIKLWLQHKILENAIDTCFAQIASNFQVKPTFYVGQRFDIMRFSVERYGKQYVNWVEDCTITHVDEHGDIEVTHTYRKLYIIDPKGTKSSTVRQRWYSGKASFFADSIYFSVPPLEYYPPHPKKF